MKFSDRTFTILKNFATINQSLLMKPGFELKTVSPQKTMMAIARLTDEIPSEACIYDMSRFLSVCSLYESPDIRFEEKNFIISEGKSRTKYVFADKSMIIAPPDNSKVNLPPENLITVNVEWKSLQSVIKAAGVLQLPEIAFVGRDGIVYLQAINSANPSADTFGIEVGDTEDIFQLIIKTENLKLIPQNYEVKLSPRGLACFEAVDVMYYVAIESKSTFRKGDE